MCKVLIVDDHQDSSSVLARLLQAEGYEPMIASAGREAIAALRQANGTPPDAMLLDIMMPDMSGLEVLREVKQNPDTARVPVVMFSAVSKPEVIDQAFHQGASDYWVKASLDFGQMMARLNRLLPRAGEAS